MSWANIVHGKKGTHARSGVILKPMSTNAAAAFSVLILLQRLKYPCEIEIRSNSYYIRQVCRMLPYWAQQPNAWMKENYQNPDIMEPVPNAKIWQRVVDHAKAKSITIFWTWTNGYETSEHKEVSPGTYIERHGDRVQRDPLDDQVEKLAKATLRNFIAAGTQSNHRLPGAPKIKDSTQPTLPPWGEFSPR